MQNRDREPAGASRLRVADFLRLAARFAAGVAAAALVFPVPPASASVPAPAAVIAGQLATPRLEQHAPVNLELAGFKAVPPPKPPVRGSSAELEGGSSADRYGGSSADRRGVAGRYDPRNRGVRQFSASRHKDKRDRNRPKQNDEMQDQDQDPPRDRYTFAPADPSQSRDSGDRD